MQGFGDVFGLDLFAPAEVGDGTGYLEDVVVREWRESQAADRYFEVLVGGGIELAVSAQSTGARNGSGYFQYSRSSERYSTASAMCLGWI